MRAQIDDIGGGHGESAGVGVAAVAGEKSAAGLDRLEQMERANRAAGAESFGAIARNHQRGTVVALHDSRRGDTDDAAMPAISVDNNAVGVAQRGIAE